MLNGLLWAPLGFALLCLVAPRGLARWLGLAGSIVALGLAIASVAGFDSGAAGLQDVVDESWIPDLGVRYSLGVDGLSVFLVLLTAVLWTASTAWCALRDDPDAGADLAHGRLFYFLLGLGETATLGAFLAQDLLLFVLFFDLMLIPFFFLIGIFGGRNRVAATTKMIVYTLVGSLLMLVGAIATAILATPEGSELSFSLADLRANLLTQTNVRLIAGYSSIAQLGFITIGIFSLRPDGADGAVLQMVNHGLVVAPVFLIIALLYERSKTEDLTEMGGLAKRAPVLAALFLVVTMALLAIPGSANFIGEFYILNGVFQAKIVYAFVAAIGVALAAFYALRLYQRTMHNRLPEGVESRELTLREGAVLAPLVACIVALALWPGLILERGEASVAESLAAVRTAPTTQKGASTGGTGAFVTHAVTKALIAAGPGTGDTSTQPSSERRP